MLKLFFFIPFLFATNVNANVVAQVGATKITLKEFNKKYKEIKRTSINPPKPEVFLEDLIRFEVGVQEAKKKKLEKDPVVIERFKQELYKAYVEKSIGKKVEGIKVTTAEMRRFYKKNPELRTSHILIEFKPNATPQQISEAKKRAEEIYAEVKKSKRPFAELAKIYSDDNFSKANGGDIEYQTRITVAPTYYDAAVKMKVGQIKGLVRTLYGFHIIKLTGVKSYDNANKRRIRMAVFDQKRARIFNRFFNKLKSKYKIKKNTKLLSKRK